MSDKKVIVRQANEKELEQVKVALIQHFHMDLMDKEEIENAVDLGVISVVENYITACPGYFGKVFYFLPDSAPEYTMMLLEDIRNVGFLKVVEFYDFEQGTNIKPGFANKEKN